MQSKFLKVFCETLVLTLLPVALLSAAEPAPDCATVIAALERVYAVDHSTATEINGKTSNTIAAGGETFINANGRWSISRISAQAALQLQKNNISDAKIYTCKVLPDQIVGGIGAAVFTTHRESEDGTTDATIAIDKAAGLPLEIHGSIAVDGNLKRYVSHYAYTDIQAPHVN